MRMTRFIIPALVVLAIVGTAESVLGRERALIHS